MKPLSKRRMPSVALMLIGHMFTTTALFAVTSSVWSDEPFPDPAPVVKTYEWSLSPAREPSPALKYRFITDLSHSKPGNAATYYTRAIIDKAGYARRTAEQAEQESTWYEMPLEKLPRDEVRTFLNKWQLPLEEVKRAAECEMCDWGVRFQDMHGLEVIQVRLSEFQEARDLGRALRLRTRLEVVEHRLDDAIDSIGQSYQLARNLSTSPMVIVNLISIAIQNVTSESVGELISTDGAPNLYWALRTMPDPQIDSLPSMQFESTMAYRIFPFLKDADTAQRPAEEWQRLLTEVIISLDDHYVPNAQMPLATRMKTTAMIMRSYPIAKRELINAGYDRGRIEQMPVGQVVAIYARDCHQYVIDESLKWVSIPFAEGFKRANESIEQLKRDEYMIGGTTSVPARDPLLINSRLGYAGTHILEASNRSRRTLAALMAIEAIRMHAAGNGGKLPASLSEISVVPVPLNPATDRPFPYRVVDQRAELLIPPTRPHDEYSGRRFLLRMR